jgi:NADH:ubiquinone oxidoreductase subunit E
MKMKKLDKDIVSFIEDCQEREHPQSYLIAVLHKIQNRYGYLSEPHMSETAERMQIPTATISGVGTFYHFFRLTPRGRHNISVCLGTACFVKGADKVLDAFRTELGIDIGETTPDRLFSLENSRCVGVCALAPVVTVNQRVLSRVEPGQVPDLIHRLRSEA